MVFFHWSEIIFKHRFRKRHAKAAPRPRKNVARSRNPPGRQRGQNLWTRALIDNSDTITAPCLFARSMSYWGASPGIGSPCLSELTCQLQWEFWLSWEQLINPSPWKRTIKGLSTGRSRLRCPEISSNTIVTDVPIIGLDHIKSKSCFCGIIARLLREQETTIDLGRRLSKTRSDYQSTVN